MSLSLGNVSIKDVYFGSIKIKEAYLGSTKVYSSGGAIPSDMDFIYQAKDFTGSYIPNKAPNSTFGDYLASGTLYTNGSGDTCYLSSNWWETANPGFLYKDLTTTEHDNIMAENGTYTFFIRMMNDPNIIHSDVGGIMSCRYNGGYIYMIRSNGDYLQIHDDSGRDIGSDFLLTSDRVYKIQISGQYYYAKNMETGDTWSYNSEATKEMGTKMTSFTAWDGNEHQLDRFYAFAGIARATTAEEDTLITNILMNQSA